jgi:hypothetical protein
MFQHTYVYIWFFGITPECEAIVLESIAKTHLIGGPAIGNWQLAIGVIFPPPGVLSILFADIKT